MGLISGYPMGAKIAVNYRENGICSKEEGERLIAFTNNSGPLFIIGTVGIGFFHSAKIGYILFISHIISSLIVGIIFKNWKKDNKNGIRYNFKIKSEKQMRFKDLGEILSSAIQKSIKTILNIGGFIVIFSVIISILENTGILNIFGDIGNIIISGIIELTSGIYKISNSGISNFNIILASTILGFGGVSVMLQVYSVISKSDISIKPYIIGKILQSVISCVITTVILILFK